MLERGDGGRDRALGLEMELYKDYGWMFDVIPHAPAKLLDIGCGHGMEARGFESRFPNLTVEGLDWSFDFFRETNPRMKGYEIDMRDMNFKNKYNVVFSSFGFSFFKEKDFPTVFKKINNALKPAGKFCFSYGEPHFSKSELNNPTIDIGLRMKDAREKLKEWLGEAGFDVGYIRKRKNDNGQYGSFEYFAVKATKKKT